MIAMSMSALDLPPTADGRHPDLEHVGVTFAILKAGGEPVLRELEVGAARSPACIVVSPIASGRHEFGPLVG